jgi:hypothetical protein
MGDLVVAPESALQDPFEYLKGLKGKNTSNRGAAAEWNESVNNFSNPAIDYDREINIASMVMDAISDASIVPKDIKIDDGDLPQAKNFYQWTTDDRFAGTVMMPFLEQLIWGIVTFGEYCWYCTDLDWLFDTHKCDDTFTKFERKVALLEYGKCPHCGKGRAQMVNNDGMKFYQELAVNAGQRSGKSACVGGMLTPYLTHRLLKLQKPSAVYGIAASTVLHGTFVALTYAQAKETLWEFFFGTLIESHWFCIAEGQNVTLKDNSVIPIEQIAVGDEVKTLDDFAPVSRTKCTGNKPCLKLELENGNKLTATPDHKVRCLADDGQSLVWKRMDELTENDFVVVEDD